MAPVQTLCGTSKGHRNILSTNPFEPNDGYRGDIILVLKNALPVVPGITVVLENAG